MVGLYNSGKPSSETIKEYELTLSTFNKLVKQYNEIGSFKKSMSRAGTSTDNLIIESLNE